MGINKQKMQARSIEGNETYSEGKVKVNFVIHYPRAVQMKM
jgi:hypothetical protein